jgi:hypothetical protein
MLDIEAVRKWVDLPLGWEEITKWGPFLVGKRLVSRNNGKFDLIKCQSINSDYNRLYLEETNRWDSDYVTLGNTKIFRKKEIRSMSVFKKIGKCVVNGIQIKSGADAAKVIVEIVKKKLGKNYPVSGYTKGQIQTIIPMIIIAYVDAYGGENKALRKLSRVAEFALTGTSEAFVELANTLVPMFSNIAALSTLIEFEENE